MGPKVQAACEFARNTGKVAVISSLENIEDIVKGTAGTRVSTAKPGSATVECSWRAPAPPFSTFQRSHPWPSTNPVMYTSSALR
jgi:hypothetical protein